MDELEYPRMEVERLYADIADLYADIADLYECAENSLDTVHGAARADELRARYAPRVQTRAATKEES